MKFNEIEYMEACKNIHNNFYTYPLGANIKNIRKDKILVNCPIHGNYMVRADHHKYGIKCRNCSEGNDIGLYNKINAERNRIKWNNIKSYLYFLEIKNDNEKFFKVGVTKNIDKRLKEFPKNYNITVQGLFENTLYTNVISENDIKEDFQNFKYKPLYKFRGWTECFKVDMLNLYYN